jgi:hypothetical protein
MFTDKEREANMLPKTKCPCENCLMIPICRNRSSSEGINVIKATEKCSLLSDFLKIIEISQGCVEFSSHLSRVELDKRLDQVNIYLPYGSLHVTK